jgi:hypothetical protein
MDVLFQSDCLITSGIQHLGIVIEVDRRQFSISTWITPEPLSLCPGSNPSVNCIHKLDGAMLTNLRAEVDVNHEVKNRLKDLGRIVVDGLELSQERIGAVPLRFLESHVRYQLSGRSPRSEGRSLFALK